MFLRISAPMQSMGPGLMPHLPCLGGVLKLPEIETIGRAASRRCALRHPRIGLHLDRLRCVADFDSSLLAPRCRAWQGSNALAHLAEALAHNNGLPTRVREASNLQRAIQTNLEWTRAQSDVMGWVRRRLGALLCDAIRDGQLRV